MTTTQPDELDPERVALLEALAQQRYFFLHTVDGLTDEQARLTPTVSELCLGGLVKHVALTERGWTDFVEHGTMAGGDDADPQARANEFRLLEGETLADGRHALPGGRRPHRRADPDLGPGRRASELPPAPWFQPGERRSARRTFVHLLAELAHHTGHADILRETIDGQKSMG